MFIKKKTYIIAEAGINHKGSYKIAKNFIKQAKKCGADAIKFQSFIAENVVTSTLALAKYQKENINKKIKMIEMIRKYELSQSDQMALLKYSKKLEIDFISSAFDLESLNFLITKLKLKILKIPSGEITNLPYLIKAAKFKKKVILSTGMSNQKEIYEAIKILTSNGLKKQNITLLHCNTSYPTPMKDVNLRVIKELEKKFKIKVGYSDHTLGAEVAIASVGIGAKVIEKHFTLNKKWEGPDQSSSLNPQEFTYMVKSIRNIDIAQGTYKKKMTNSESKNIIFARKSIVASQNIKVGERFSLHNIVVKRPGNGISPMQWFKVLKLKAKKNFKKDDLIKI